MQVQCTVHCTVTVCSVDCLDCVVCSVMCSAPTCPTRLSPSSGFPSAQALVENYLRLPQGSEQRKDYVLEGMGRYTDHLHPASCCYTLHPAPTHYTLHNARCTLGATPCTMHPAALPSTLHYQGDICLRLARPAGRGVRSSSRDCPDQVEELTRPLEYSPTGPPRRGC